MRVTWVLLIAALADAAVFGLSGFGTQLGWWDYRTGLEILRASAIAALAIGACVVVALLVPRLRAGGVTNAIAALVISLGILWLPVQWMQQAARLPVINDITTDTIEPPAFVAILPLRAGAPVPAVHPGTAVAQAQRAAYPDVVPLSLRVPPAEAFANAVAVASAAGWEIVAMDPAAGRIEATATTKWFGFKDDIVIRIRAAPGGSRVDVRSVSRVGKSDLGTNARRIRAYLARLAL